MFGWQWRARHKAGDGCGARATIGLENVTIDNNAAFAERGEIDYGTQGAADEALNFVGAARGAAFGEFARSTRRGGAGQHGIFGGDPALAAAAQKGRDGIFHGGRAQYAGVADFDQDGPFGGEQIICGDLRGAELVVLSAVFAHELTMVMDSGRGPRLSALI